MWNYKEADPNKIRKALDLISWERLFDQKSNDTQVATFNDTILNIFCNFVPNKYITIDESDLKWFESDFIFLENLTAELYELISSTKTSYYENLAKKLNNPLLQAKAYWSILKKFIMRKKFHEFHLVC